MLQSNVGYLTLILIVPAATPAPPAAAGPAAATAGMAGSSYGTVGVDVMYKREPIEPMESDKKYDGNGATAVANMDDVLNKHDGLFEINRELIERNSNRKRNRSYVGDYIVVAPECHCIASPPLCHSASSRDTVTSVLRHRTDDIAPSATVDGRTMARMS